MSANLTQQYRKAEQAYRQAATPQEELACLQTMLVELPKHKGTDKMQADLKQKISVARKEVSNPTKPSIAKSTARFPRQGAGRVVIIGPPNSGKSQLLASLTRATPEIAPYPFTTQKPMPAMMPWQDVYVQLVDTPPITADMYDATTQALIRGADLVLLILDLGIDSGAIELQQVLRRLETGKTRLGSTSRFSENDIGVTFTKTLLVKNKIDKLGAMDRNRLFEGVLRLDFQPFEVSGLEATGLEALRDEIYKSMNVVRIYTKAPSRKEPEYDKPFTLQKGGTLQELAELVHHDFAANLKKARVWGEAVHAGTIVKGDYVLHDGDVVELHI